MAVYAVDFDGTLAITRFPEIIEAKPKIVAAVKLLKAQGHKVILWTSRAGKDLEAAVEWCKAQGIVFDAINAPLPEQTVSREACTAMIEHAYAMGYMDAKERERKRKKALREKRERKKYFITQKLYGVAVLFLTVVAVKLLDGDATIALFTVPLGVTLIASKEMLIINEYYWKCEEENGICN